jgi:hypothetical protein
MVAVALPAALVATIMLLNSRVGRLWMRWLGMRRCGRVRCPRRGGADLGRLLLRMLLRLRFRPFRAPPCGLCLGRFGLL